MNEKDRQFSSVVSLSFRQGKEIWVQNSGTTFLQYAINERATLRIPHALHAAVRVHTRTTMHVHCYVLSGWDSVAASPISVAEEMRRPISGRNLLPFA